MSHEGDKMVDDVVVSEKAVEKDFKAEKQEDNTKMPKFEDYILYALAFGLLGKLVIDIFYRFDEVYTSFLIGALIGVIYLRYRDVIRRFINTLF